ncbi:uncharacterized protein [Ptychodera flava]|uniref:uncharacterized protein n=1 Tax=Ptychodera flava TaxID=63121 RepID=UPI003969EDB8
MRFFFVLTTLITVAYGRPDEPIQLKPWKCHHLVRKVYNNAIWNAVVTDGLDCFDALMELPDKMRDLTPIRTFQVYGVGGPYIGKSKTRRYVAVLADQVDTVDLGTKIKNESAIICDNCTFMLYDGDMLSVRCDVLSMEECPDRLSDGIYWNPPGNITASSDVELCSFKRVGDTSYIFCMYYEPDIDMPRTGKFGLEAVR